MLNTSKRSDSRISSLISSLVNTAVSILPTDQSLCVSNPAKEGLSAIPNRYLSGERDYE